MRASYFGRYTWAVLGLLGRFITPVTAEDSVLLNICNDYADNIFISWDTNPGSNCPGDQVIPQGDCHQGWFSSTWGGAFYVGLRPNGKSTGNSRNWDTKVEFCVLCHEGFHFFDVDVEKGISVPVVVTAHEGGVWSGCAVDKLTSCRKEWRHNDGEGNIVHCRVPSERSDNPDEWRHWREWAREGCPQVYVNWNDEQTRVDPAAKYFYVRVGV